MYLEDDGRDIFVVAIERCRQLQLLAVQPEDGPRGAGDLQADLVIHPPVDGQLGRPRRLIHFCRLKQWVTNVVKINRSESIKLTRAE